jgi:hypothetical protein
MANSKIVCAYAAQAFSQSTGSLTALLSGVGLKTAHLKTVSLFPSADATALVGATATRTITLKMGSLFSQTSNIVIPSGQTRGPILSVGLTGGVHTDYASPPIVSFTDPTGSGAKASAIMGAGATVMFANGSGYNPATTTVTLANAQLDPKGTPAVLTPIIVAGAFMGVTIVSPGSGYNRFGTLVIVDSSGAGSGAVGIMSLKPVSIKMFSGGNGYTGPTMTLTPAFIARCPDSGNQAGMIKGWMKSVLAQLTGLAIQELAPVVS